MADPRIHRPRTIDSPANRAPWILGIVLVAALFRLPMLDRVPPALNQDEASFGYNAWSLWETGKDRAGQAWPFFSLSFGPGDFPATLSVFLTIPFVAALGPTPVAFRLPVALAGIATVWLLYVWLRPRLGDFAALLATVALAADPWHVALTRTAHEAALAPLLLTLALLGLDRAGLFTLPNSDDEPADRLAMSSPRRAAFAFLAGVMLALHTWLYSATRMFTPLFILALAVIRARPILHSLRAPGGLRVLLAIVAGLILGGAPLEWTALTHPERITARVGATLIDFRGQPIADTLMQLAKNYLIYLDPRLWFVAANDVVGTPMPGLGLHLWIAAPFMLAGLLILLRRIRRDERCRFLIVWLVLAPLPAVICREDHPHALRTVGGLLLWPLLAGIGALSFHKFWNRASANRRGLVIAIVGATFLANLAWFTQRYFVVYPARAESGFQATLYAAMRRAREIAPNADFFLTTGRANQAYIYALLVEPIPPRRLRDTPMIREAAPGNFHQVLRVGRWFFAPTDPANYPQALTRFEEAWNALPGNAKGLVITTPGVFTGGTLVETIPCASGRPEDGYELRAVAFGSP